MAYICLIRDDIPAGTMQVLDLWPNTSQRNQSIDPVGQTKYLTYLTNSTVATTTSGGGVITTNAAYTGLAAYLIENVEKGGLAAGTGALTAADANTISAAIIAAMEASTAMGLAAVNALIAATAANSELTSYGGSASTGSLADVLKILAGGEWITPAGTTVSTTGVFTASPSGMFTSGQYRATYAGQVLSSSVDEGQLAGFMFASFEYGGTAGAAVVVYDADGALIV